MYRDGCSYKTRNTWQSMMMVSLLVSHQSVADRYQNSQQHHKCDLQVWRYCFLKILPLSMQLDRSLLMMSVSSMTSMSSMCVTLVFFCAMCEMCKLRMSHRRLLGFVIVLCHSMNWLRIISGKIIKICLSQLYCFSQSSPFRSCNSWVSSRYYIMLLSIELCIVG